MRAEIRSGHAKFERKLAVCSGGALLSPENRVELLAVLTHDSAFADRAKAALLTQPVPSFLAALAREDAAAELFDYCAENLTEKAGIADAMARNAACPAETLVRAARAFSINGVQALLDRLERLTETPILVAALLRSGAASAEQRELLKELQEGPAPGPGLEEAVADAEPDPHKRLSLLQRLARMNVVERVQLAIKGNREERMALIRDNCKIVQRAVLQSARLSESEVESFAAMGNLSTEVLRVIGGNRSFIKNYMIVRNLVNNAKTPLEVSLHLLPRLTERDTKLLTTNRNIPDTLRSMALKLHRQRNDARRDS